MGDITVNLLKIGEILQKNNFQYVPLKTATPEEFYKAVEVAKSKNEFGSFVTKRTIEEYSKMPFLFLTLDNTAGIAITSDNNIVSIFYSRDGKPDIVFWVHNGDSTEDVILNFGNYIVDWEHVHTFKTYDEAEGYRDRIIKDNE